MEIHIYKVSFYQLLNQYIYSNKFYLKDGYFWFDTNDEIVAMFPENIVLAIRKVNEEME